MQTGSESGSKLFWVRRYAAQTERRMRLAILSVENSCLVDVFLHYHGDLLRVTSWEGPRRPLSSEAIDALILETILFCLDRRNRCSDCRVRAYGGAGDSARFRHWVQSAEHQQIFETFYTTKLGGLGMGFSIRRYKRRRSDRSSDLKCLARARAIKDRIICASPNYLRSVKRHDCPLPWEKNETLRSY